MADSRNKLLGVAVFWLLAILAPLASGAPSLPATRPLFDWQPPQLRLSGEAADQAHVQIVPVEGQEFPQAWRVDLSQQPQEAFQVELVSPIPFKLDDRESVVFSVWVRAPGSPDPDHQGHIGLVLEQSTAPYDKLLARQYDVSAEWRRLDVAASVHHDIAAGGTQLSLRLGYLAQTLEVGGTRLRVFDSSVALADLPQTPCTYRGREADAPWRAAAEQRIDQLRKALLTVRVTDADGKPVAGASVQIRMLRQGFPFGCDYNDDCFDATQSNSSDNQAYRDHFQQLFNTGVDEWAMKWPHWDNPADRRKAMVALQWMHEHEIAVRGHNLVWPAWRHLPPDLRALANDPAALEKRIDDHIRDEVSALAGQVIEWDVVNEPYFNNDLMHILGGDAMAGWFKLAHEVDPAPRLYLNEEHVPDSPPRDRRYDALYNQVLALQKQGAPIGGIGMESHFQDGLTAPDDLLAIYDRFAKLGLPVRITELDVDSNDEQLQADYFRDFLTASFSHPQINGILLWGFWESQHWRPDAALFRKDWSIKPNGQVWKNLVMGKWWTNADGATGANGTYSTRGFLGDYQVVVTAGQRSQTVKISLPHEARTVDVALK
jgi:GH35 family endo-1,4-beta-xylanase